MTHFRISITTKLTLLSCALMSLVGGCAGGCSSEAGSSGGTGLAFQPPMIFDAAVSAGQTLHRSPDGSRGVSDWLSGALSAKAFDLASGVSNFLASPGTSYAWSVNDGGEIVGYWALVGGGPGGIVSEGVYWPSKDSDPVALPVECTPLRITNSGQVFARVEEGSTWKILSFASPSDSSPMVSASGIKAHYISASGAVFGTDGISFVCAESPSGPYRQITLPGDGSPDTFMGTATFSGTGRFAVTNNGYGSSQDAPPVTINFRTGEIVPLPLPPGVTGWRVTDSNSSGEFVGYASGGTEIPVLVSGGIALDFNDIVGASAGSRIRRLMLIRNDGSVLGLLENGKWAFFARASSGS